MYATAQLRGEPRARLVSWVENQNCQNEVIGPHTPVQVLRNQHMIKSSMDDWIGLQGSDTHCWPPRNEYRNPSLSGVVTMHFLSWPFLLPKF